MTTYRIEITGRFQGAPIHNLLADGVVVVEGQKTAPVYEYLDTNMQPGDVLIEEDGESIPYEVLMPDREITKQWERGEI